MIIIVDKKKREECENQTLGLLGTYHSFVIFQIP
jgi:hypothetical protein